MADKKDFYYQQPVQENELDEAFDALEVADRNLAADTGIAAVDNDANRGGIFKGLDVSNPSGVNVDVTTGAAYDNVGRRIGLITQKTVDLSSTGQTAVGAGGTPTGGVATSPGAGNRRWVSLFIVFDRDLSDPRVDGGGAPLFFNRAESFRFTVAQGEAAASPTDKAPLESGKLLLGDFRVTDATSIDLIDTSRRQVWLRGRDNAGVPVTRAGSGFPVRGLEEDSGIREVIEKLLGYYNDHVRNDGSQADKHNAESIEADAIAGSPVSINAGNASEQLASLVSELNDHINFDDYEHTIDAIADAPLSLSSGTLTEVITELLSHINQAALLDSNNIGSLTVDGEYNYSPVKSKTRIIPLASGVSTEWELENNNGGQWSSTVNGGQVYFPIHLPHGAVITGVRANVDPGTTTGAIQLLLTKRTFTGFAAGTGTTDNIASVTSDGTINAQIIEDISISPSGLIDDANSEYYIRVTASSDGGTTSDKLLAIQIDYTDPGPRNG